MNLNEYLILVIGLLFDIISIAILARVIMSWVARGASGKLVEFIKDVTDPILNVAKKITPKVGMIDFSPIVALIALDLIKFILLSLLQ